MTKLMRAHKVSYINTGSAYKFMGTGFTELGEELNPDVAKKMYINDEQESATLRKYAPEYAFAFDRDTTDDAQAYIVGIADARATGSAAETDYIHFLDTDVNVSTGLVDCYKQSVVVSVSTTGGGAAGEELTCSGTLIANGDPVSGTWDTATDTFTPDVS